MTTGTRRNKNGAGTIHFGPKGFGACYTQLGESCDSLVAKNTLTKSAGWSSKHFYHLKRLRSNLVKPELDRSMLI